MAANPNVVAMEIQIVKYMEFAIYFLLSSFSPFCTRLDILGSITIPSALMIAIGICRILSEYS